MSEPMQQFADTVIYQLMCYMGEEYEIKKDCVTKNNGTKLDSILIIKKGETITPSIYINEYFEEYNKGRTIDSIVEEMISCYENCSMEKELLNATLDISFEAVKNRIIYRLVNYEKNKEILEAIPHFEFLDLAIIFHCIIKKDCNEIGTIRVTNDWMNEWGITKEELLELAASNTPRIFPVRIRPMEAVMEDIIRQDVEKVLNHYSVEALPIISEKCKEDAMEDMISSLMKELRKKDTLPIYVLTNTCGMNGAGTLIYKDVIQQFAEEYQSDFYILPSSIHEVLLIPYDMTLEKKALMEMVSDINGSQVPTEDVLSNQVYIYNRNSNTITM